LRCAGTGRGLPGRYMGVAPGSPVILGWQPAIDAGGCHQS
jgi:hypothetical protein